MENTDLSYLLANQILVHRQIMSYLFIGVGVLTLLVGFAVVLRGTSQSGETTIKLLGLEISAKQLGAVVMVTSFAWGFLAYQMRTTLDLDLGSPVFETERLLPWDENKPIRTKQVTGRLQAISPVGKQWVNASTISVSFIGGTKIQRVDVEKWSSEWTEFANLDFKFGGNNPGDIRISFDNSAGSWSYQGNDAKKVPSDTPTMNLADTHKGTVLRMFGIAIGLQYVQAPQEGESVWNVNRIVQDLSGPPNYYKPEFIKRFIDKVLSAPSFVGDEFDKESIMVRPIPPNWTTNNIGVDANESLSEGDKKLIAHPKFYPGLT